MAFNNFSKWLPSAILDFLRLEFVTACTVPRVIVQSFVLIGQVIADIWQFFNFFQMAALHHLGFVMCMFGALMTSIWWYLSLCKMWFKLM